MTAPLIRGRNGRAWGEGDLDLRGKSLLIFDDGLRSLSGHWYEYDRATAELHRARGARVTLICHRDFAEREALEGVGVEVLPIVERSLWSGAFGARGGNEWLAMAANARYFARVLKAHLATRRYDLAFVPNAMVHDALAWRLVGWRRVGRLALLFRFSVPGVSPLRRPARKFAVWRLLFHTLRRAVSRGRVALLTDSPRLRREYRRIAGIEPRVISSPRTLPPAAARRYRSRPAVTFAMIGYATWGRGIDRFEAAIGRLLAEGPDGLRFILQRHVAVVDGRGQPLEPAPALLASERVELIDRALPSQDYARVFERIDCMVLPYRRSHYHSQISGVAIEAACAGVPLIVTADTWLSDFAAEQGAGIAVPDGDVEALAAAIRGIAAEYPAWRTRALERSATARERNSPEAFLRTLWGLGDDSDGGAAG